MSRIAARGPTLPRILGHGAPDQLNVIPYILPSFPKPETQPKCLLDSPQLSNWNLGLGPGTWLSDQVPGGFETQRQLERATAGPLALVLHTAPFCPAVHTELHLLVALLNQSDLLSFEDIP